MAICNRRAITIKGNMLIIPKNSTVILLKQVNDLEVEIYFDKLKSKGIFKKIDFDIIENSQPQAEKLIKEGF